MQQHTLLLVDDNTSNCLLLQRVLERERFHVVCACDGEDALLLYSLVHHDIDLVILDVDIPGKNGADCLEAVRRINPDVCCLAITAHIDHPCLKRMVSLGISGILRKPFSNDELIKWVERLMRPQEVERLIRQQTPLRNNSYAN